MRPKSFSIGWFLRLLVSPPALIARRYGYTVNRHETYHLCFLLRFLRIGFPYIRSSADASRKGYDRGDSASSRNWRSHKGREGHANSSLESSSGTEGRQTTCRNFAKLGTPDSGHSIGCDR